MKKRLLRHFALALCLCMFLAGSITASASTGIENVSDNTNGSGISQTQDEGTPPPLPEPEKDAKYIITISAPHGWYTKSASVTVRLDDVNLTGFEKSEAKIGTNGSWQDISDGLRAYGWAHVEISDNATVYVTVTDKKGKAHVKSLYIECFDREAPTARAKIEGRMLRVETDDSLSGVEYVNVNGYRFDDLTNGTLDIRVKDYVDEDEQEIYVQAVDCAGNKSKTVQVKNPYYNPPSSSKADTGQSSSTAPVSSSAPAAQAPAASAPAAASSSQATSQPAPAAQVTQPAASSASNTDNGSVTPTDGTGTVIENSVKTSEQREFFTITTEAGNDYYIVVDKEKSDKNVYLLSQVTEDDLTGLAKPSTTEHAIPDPAPVEAVKPEPEPDAAKQEPEAEPEAEPAKADNTGSVIIIAVAVLIFGIAAWYFKIYKPKQDAFEDDWEDDTPDGDEAPDETAVREDDEEEPLFYDDGQEDS